MINFQYLEVVEATPMKIVDKYHEEKLTKDAVNSPSHYSFGGIECIDYLKDNMPKEAFEGYLEGNFKK